MGLLDSNGLTYFWTKIKQYADAAASAGGVPSGVITMWSGAADAIPSGWSLCNGENGTPDLRGKFVLGAGGTYNPGSTGGSEKVTLTVEQMPSHCHDYDEGKEGRFKDGTTLYGKTTLQSKLAQGLGTTEYAGDGQPHPNMPPYYALCYIMKL